MPKRTTDTKLALVAKHLPTRWRVRGISATNPKIGSAVNAVLAGEGHTKDLPADIAAALICELGPSVLNTVLDGETRITVLDAAGVHTATDDARIPSAFRGEIDTVEKNLRLRRTTMSPSACITGLNARNENDRARLVAVAMRCVAASNRFELIAAACTGELHLDPVYVTDQVLETRDGLNPHTTMKLVRLLSRAGVNPDVFTQVICRLCTDNVVRARVGDINEVYIDAVAVACVGWPKRTRLRTAEFLWCCGVSAEQFSDVIDGAATAQLIRWAGTPRLGLSNVALSKLNAQDISGFDNETADNWALVRVMAANRENITPEMFAAAFVKQGAHTQLHVLAANSPQVSAECVDVALDAMGRVQLRELFNAAHTTAAAYDAAVYFGSGWELPAVKTLNTVGLGVLFARMAEQNNWAVVWSLVEVHSAAAVGMATALAAAADRASEQGADVNVVTLALVGEMADTFTGTLDELIVTCASLTN